MEGILLLSVMAGLATCLGGSFVILLGRPSEKILAVFLGMAAGIMIAVVILDLLPSAIHFGNIVVAFTGFLLGLLLMLSLDSFLSLFFPDSQPATGRTSYLLKMGYLIGIGISLHDLPEGIAIAAGYSATEHLGGIIALAIGLHNIPEGMATAAPLLMGGLSGRKIIAILTLVSAFTPLGSLLGLVLVGISRHLISLLLAMAGGAMAYIVKEELLPESRRRHPNFAKLGMACGFVLILFLSLTHS